MKRNFLFDTISPWGQLFLLIGLLILSSLVSAFTGLLIGRLYLGVDLNSLAAYISDPQTARSLAFVKFYQFINQVGVFFVPVLLFAWLVSRNPFAYLDMTKAPRLLSMLVAGVMVYTILPFNQYLLELNNQLHLPGFLAGIENWMLQYEEKAEKLTALFLSSESPSVLLLNLFIVALIPAIGEEWLFRGVLLKQFRTITGSFHWAVIITSFLFAALHLQFLSFLPRFVLGIMLGYLFVITRNLWVPIMAHLVNNASTVVLYYLHQHGYVKVSPEDFGSATNVVYVIGSLLITLWLMVILSNRERAVFK